VVEVEVETLLLVQEEQVVAVMVVLAVKLVLMELQTLVVEAVEETGTLYHLMVATAVREQ
jgi:hypothetical protein